MWNGQLTETIELEHLIVGDRIEIFFHELHRLLQELIRSFWVVDDI